VIPQKQQIIKILMGQTYGIHDGEKIYKEKTRNA